MAAYRTTPVALGIIVFTLALYFFLGTEHVPFTYSRGSVELSSDSVLTLSDAELASIHASDPQLANSSPYRQRLALFDQQNPNTATKNVPHPHLGVASRIIVIGLARRTDRRAHMERLGRAMGLQFDWYDAIHTADPRVFEIRERVRLARETSRRGVEDVVPDLNFSWSDEVEKMLKDGVPDEPVGKYLLA